MARVLWTRAAQNVLIDLPVALQEEIARKTRPLARFPRMYPVRQHGRFRRHRHFLVKVWIVFYRVVDNTVYIRGLWPARIP